MKSILLVFCLSQAAVVWAEKSLAPTNVISAVSKFSFGKTGERTIYRALTFFGGEEGAMSLGLEKYKIGEYGSPDKIFVQKKIVIPKIEGFKSFIDQISKKSIEATYGCCKPKNVKWDKNKKLTFNLEFEDRIFNRGFIKRNGKKVDTAQYSHTEVSYFNCQSSTLDASKLKVKCAKVKTEKTVKK